jgi:eukaryotic-like serine/threonine-protein kinase
MTEHSATGLWPTSAAPSAADRPVIPGYEILEELGRGGMGVVYKARQLSLKRLVALKLIRDGALAGQQDRGRFRIEAEAAARMQHPNIVQVYEAGEHQGRLYFAMEFVEGVSLDQHIAGRPQPVTQAAELVRTLALAIDHAHAQQIVHRDLKPANVLLSENLAPSRQDAKVIEKAEEADRATPSDFPVGGLAALRELSPKITDFGLAKRLDIESTVVTLDGTVMGTASYMAPEQAAGRVRAIGPAVDVYALGAILYELLTGRPPFQAETWQQTVEQVLHDEPTPPSRLRAELPRDLETVCLKCLEKEPNRRYAAAAELAGDLGRFLEGQPVAAPSLSEHERLTRLAARDGYQIVEEIGRGPRSIVYRAGYGPLRQVVAVKVFAKDACTHEEWHARQRRDAEMWAALVHPHIVPVQRAGWWDGAAYVSGEYVPHGSLAAKLAGQPAGKPRAASVSEAVRLVGQLAEIVSFVHRQGIVHGNLKPSNVLFAADGIPRLADFRATAGLHLTSIGQDNADPAGVAYLAPEFLCDPNAEPHPYTDIYGLGMILYEMLAGRPPFIATSAAELLEQVRSQEPAPPSQFNADVTPHLAKVCLRCLRKNPWRRYYRVYDLLTRLRYFQDS